jgi:hypothetical protein
MEKRDRMAYIKRRAWQSAAGYLPFTAGSAPIQMTDFAQLIIIVAYGTTRYSCATVDEAKRLIRSGLPAMPSEVWNEDQDGMRIAGFEVATCGRAVALVELSD